MEAGGSLRRQSSLVADSLRGAPSHLVDPATGPAPGGHNWGNSVIESGEIPLILVIVRTEILAAPCPRRYGTPSTVELSQGGRARTPPSGQSVPMESDSVEREMERLQRLDEALHWIKVTLLQVERFVEAFLSFAETG